MAKWSFICAAIMSVSLGAAHAASPSAAGVSYGYDAQGRLIEATYDNGMDIVYTYDAAGNRTSQALYVPSSANPNGNSPLSAFTLAQCQFYPTAEGGVTVSCATSPGGTGNTYANTFPSGPTALTLSNGTLYALNEAYAAIARIYVAVLNRKGGTDELTFWYTHCYSQFPASIQANPTQALLATSSGCGGIIQSFLASSENQTNNTLPTTFANDADRATFVQTVFGRILGRAPSAADITLYVNFLDNGMTPAQEISFITTSAEAVNFNQVHQDPTNGVASGWIVPESVPQI